MSWSLTVQIVNAGAVDKARTSLSLGLQVSDSDNWRRPNSRTHLEHHPLSFGQTFVGWTNPGFIPNRGEPLLLNTNLPLVGSGPAEVVLSSRKCGRGRMGKSTIYEGPNLDRRLGWPGNRPECVPGWVRFAGDRSAACRTCSDALGLWRIMRIMTLDLLCLKIPVRPMTRSRAA